VASKFEELMANYGKINQFPLPGPLPPLANKSGSQSKMGQAEASSQDSIRQTIPLQAVIKKHLKPED